MSKLRQDAWMEENDTLLAQAVLKHVREGSTQLNAFEEAGDTLNRTAAACGFRWNAVVRKQYEQELAEAKKERKERLRAFRNANKRRPNLLQSTDSLQNATPIALSNLSLDVVIAYLIHLQHQSNDLELAKWRKMAMAATNKLKEYENEIAKLKKENKEMKEDYEQFVSIMNRARKMVVFNDDSRISPVFEMEKNGNLLSKNVYTESESSPENLL